MAILKAFIVPHPPLIVPQVGRGEEKKIQNTIDAYREAARQIASLSPKTVVIITPHSVMYGDYIHISPGEGARGDFASFGTPEVSMYQSYDTEFVSKLCETAWQENVPAGTLGEKDSALDHGVLVPLYFLKEYLQDFKIVRVAISGMSYLTHYKLGQCIAKTAEVLGRDIAVVASGDLSHKLKDYGPYGYAKEGPEFDKQLTDALKDADFIKLLRFEEHFCEAAGECGLRSFITMAGVLDGKEVDTEFISYEGPFGVGYAVCRYTPTSDNVERHFANQYEEVQNEQITSIRSNEDEYVSLARKTLETYVKKRISPEVPRDLPDDITKRRAGVFVSIKKDGRLRGCMGTIEPCTDSIAEEICANAISAGTGDPRFDPITKDELSKLIYNVDVLGESEDISSIDELDVKRYGVIVSKGARRGLLLPNLEGIDTPQQQVDIALKKAGINGNKYEMQRFEVVRHK